MNLRSFFPNLLKTLKGRSGLTKKIVDLDKTPVLEGAARELADVAPTAEEVAKAEKLLNDQELGRLKITPGSLEQLMRAPHTIADPETKRWASDLYKSWDAANMRAEPYNAESILKNLEKSQAARSTSGYRGFEEGAPTTQEMRLRKLKEFAEGKAEGARDIYLPDFSNAGKKAAAIAALTGGGLAASSLMPEEAEAAFPGSVTARKKLLEKTEQIMDAWTSGAKSAGGGRELREQLAKQLDLDPTGAAKKEVLRRLAAKTEVRQNPVTGEHEFKVYRGGVKNRFSESPQSFTTNPDVAQEFADAYGGTVKETWLPASKVGSMPGAMKEGQYLGSEGEVIAKPFNAPASEYIEKPETLHQKITRRGQSSPEEADDFINELMSEGSRGKKAAGIAAAAGIGVGALGSSSAYASDEPTVSQSNPEFASASASKQSKEAYVPNFAKPIVKSALEGSALINRMEEEGKLSPDIGSYLYDTAYKYAIDPAKRKVMGALKGEEVPEDETPGYSDIYKQAMENVGKENVGKFLKGFASSAAEDPTGMTQEAIKSAKEEDVADAIANIAGTASEFAEDPLAPVTLGASRLARLPKTMRAISKFKTR